MSPVHDDSAQPTVRSVERALDLLEFLERAGRPLRLVELSRGTGLSSATLLRLLNVLQRRRLVTAENGEYRLGVATLGIAHGYLSTDPLGNRARPHLQQLANTTKLTTSLYVRTGAERILAVRVSGDEPFRYELPLGRRLPLHLGAGKAILAFLPPDVAGPIVSDAGGTRTAGGVTVTPDDLALELDAIREHGFHISIAERDVAVAAVSVPVRSLDGSVVAALSASGPSESTSLDRLETWVPELRRAAAAVGQ